MASLNDLFPKGGIFGTGFNRWGINGANRVLIEYNERATVERGLMEPVDEVKDRYGLPAFRRGKAGITVRSKPLPPITGSRWGERHVAPGSQAVDQGNRVFITAIRDPHQ